MLIVDKPAGLVVHPSAGHGSGTLVNALLGRARDRGEPLGSIAGVGRPGHRASARQGDERADRGRQDRCGAGQPHAPVRRPQHREGVPGPRARRAARVARPGRGADRPRSARSAADGGRRRRPRVDHRVRGRSAPAAGTRCSRSIRSPAGRTRSAPTCRYLGLPIAGDLRYGGGEGPGGLRRQFLHAARLALERPGDGARLQRLERAAAGPGRLPRGGRGRRRRRPPAARASAPRWSRE